MKVVKKIERMLERYWENLPHLSKGAAKVLADNLWGATLITLALLVVVLFISWLGLVEDAIEMYGSATAKHDLSGLVVRAMMIVLNLLFIAIAAVAIAPLKAYQKKGWDLAFLMLLMSAGLIICILLTVIVIVDLLTVVYVLLFFPIYCVPIIAPVIGFYILFETRSHFTTSTHKPVSRVGQ